jgi:hypothetical protein
MKSDPTLRMVRPTPMKSVAADRPRRNWLNKEEYEALDEERRASYTLDGAYYRLKPSANEIGQEKFGLIVLASLVVMFTALGIYGSATDKWTLEILAFCGAMPTLFGFLAQLAMYFSA